MVLYSCVVWGCVFYGGGTVGRDFLKSLVCIVIRNILYIVRKMVLLIKKAGRRRFFSCGI